MSLILIHDLAPLRASLMTCCLCAAFSRSVSTGLAADACSRVGPPRSRRAKHEAVDQEECHLANGFALSWFEGGERCCEVFHQHSGGRVSVGKRGGSTNQPGPLSHLAQARTAARA